MWAGRIHIYVDAVTVCSCSLHACSPCGCSTLSVSFKHILSFLFCSATGVPSLTEQQLDSMCPSAAAIAAIVKPGMKFFDVSHTGLVIIVVITLFFSHPFLYSETVLNILKNTNQHFNNYALKMIYRPV